MNTGELQENAIASRYLFKRPKALQWFHEGELKKESEDERQAGRFELFLDLLCMSQPCQWMTRSYTRFSLGPPRPQSKQSSS
jgi:hypothetical protein